MLSSTMTEKYIQLDSTETKIMVSLQYGSPLVYSMNTNTFFVLCVPETLEQSSDTSSS